MSEARAAKYYGQWDPPVDQVLEQIFFPNRRGGVALECGAFDGVYENCTKYFEDSLGWRTINVEPLPHIFQMLARNRCKPSSVNINMALSNNCSTKVFTKIIHPTFRDYCTNGSLQHMPQHIQLLKDIGCTQEQVEVQCTTYQQLVDERLQLTHLDLFVLDVEGHELSVLEGMIGAKTLPKVFVIEYPHLGLDAIQAAVKQVHVGYTLHCKIENNAFFVLEELPRT